MGRLIERFPGDRRRAGRTGPLESGGKAEIGPGLHARMHWKRYGPFKTNFAGAGHDDTGTGISPRETKWMLAWLCARRHAARHDASGTLVGDAREAGGLIVGNRPSDFPCPTAVG